MSRGKCRASEYCRTLSVHGWNQHRQEKKKWWLGWKEWVLVCCALRRVAVETGAAAVGKGLADPLQTKHRSLRWFSNSTSDYGSKWTTADIQRLVHEYSSWQIFKTGSEVETIQLPSGGWAAQSDIVYPHYEILACHEWYVSQHGWLSEEQDIWKATRCVIPYGRSVKDGAIIQMKEDGWMPGPREESLLMDTVSCGGDGEELISGGGCIALSRAAELTLSSG